MKDDMKPIDDSAPAKARTPSTEKQPVQTQPATAVAKSKDSKPPAKATLQVDENWNQMNMKIGDEFVNFDLNAGLSLNLADKKQYDENHLNLDEN